MKNFMLMLGLIFLGVFAKAQNIEAFFHDKGVEELAYCAHPTNTYANGTYQVFDDCVIVNINYEGGIYTKLRINRNNGYFSGIRVLEDTDFFPPFLAIENIIRAALRDKDVNVSDNQVVRELENMLDKELQDWKGADWTLLLINLDYFSN